MFFFLDESEDAEVNVEMDIKLPSLGPDKLSNISSVDAEQSNDRTDRRAGPGRVKVKLKSARLLEPHRSYSDAQTPSDTAKKNIQSALEMNDTAMEKEDSNYSDGQTSELQTTVSEKLPRKAGSIKIKSSKGLGFSNDTMQNKNLHKLNSPPRIPIEKNLVVSDNEKTTDSSAPRASRQRETKPLYTDSHRSEKELSDALAVIKKVMKMDAAGPFNTPVNPVALGIPDYFDIIDNPMDFGTICHELEHGCKYMNSGDVYKDVQFIWENCYKYNNKGDYIIDLMKRVKKNFMKYWISAGLYSDLQSSGGTEGNQIGDAIQCGNDKPYPKSKSKHKRRRYGIDLHKSDCLCAVCVVRRRRKEREDTSVAVGSQMATSDSNLSREFKESSPVDNPCSEDATSSLNESTENDRIADVDEAETEEKLHTLEKTDSAQPDQNTSRKNELSDQSPLENGSKEDSKQQSLEEEMDLDSVSQPSDKIDYGYRHQETENKQHASETSLQIKLSELPLLQENHAVLQLCSDLFSSDQRSMWNGPHSLRRRHVSMQDSPIQAAVASLMNL